MKHRLASGRLRAKGFTLLELMMVVLIIGVVAALAGPNLVNFIRKNRLKGAAEEARAMLQFARSESVKRSEDVFVNFDNTDGSIWCFGVATTSGCNCNDTTSCTISISGSDVLKRVTNAEYRDVVMANPGAGADYGVQFDYNRGLTTDNGHITFTNGSFEIQVRVSALGRVFICSPSDTSKKVLGYEDCPSP